MGAVTGRRSTRNTLAAPERAPRRFTRSWTLQQYLQLRARPREARPTSRADPQQDRRPWGGLPTFIDRVLFGPLAEPRPTQTPNPTQPKTKTTHSSKPHHPLNPHDKPKSNPSRQHYHDRSHPQSPTETQGTTHKPTQHQNHKALPNKTSLSA